MSRLSCLMTWGMRGVLLSSFPLVAEDPLSQTSTVQAAKTDSKTPQSAVGEKETSTTSTSSSTVQPGVNAGDDGHDQSQWGAWMIEGSQVAKDYVDTLDKGQYAPSWTKGDALFQRTISQKEWTTALNLARKRLGHVKSRTLKDQRPAWDPHGLPKGPYMVVEYNTSFEHAPNSGELLTLRRGPDGKWRVLTYQVN